jgi:HK97 family phage portal protein
VGEDVWGDHWGWRFNTTADQKVSQESALRLIAVLFCVSLLADMIASLPIETFRTQKGSRSLVSNFGWIDNPNAELSPYDFWFQVMVSLLLDGNAFVYVYSGPQGKQLIPLPPQAINPFRIFDGKIVYVYGGDYAQANPLVPHSVILDYADVLHVKAFSRAGFLRGLSPIAMARESIGLGLALEDYAARFFGQGATLAGAIESPMPLNKEQAEVMARSFAAHHAGGRKAHLPMILTSGASFKPVTVPNDQAQFLDSRRFSKVEIANLYRIPAYLLDPQVSSTWGSGVEEQNRMLIDVTLAPWTTRLEKAFSGLLPRGTELKFNLDGLLRGRTIDRYQSHKIGIEAGFMSINEVRAIEDLPWVEGGDVIRELLPQMSKTVNLGGALDAEADADADGDAVGDVNQDAEADAAGESAPQVQAVEIQPPGTPMSGPGVAPTPPAHKATAAAATANPGGQKVPGSADDEQKPKPTNSLARG